MNTYNDATHHADALIVPILLPLLPLMLHKASPSYSLHMHSIVRDGSLKHLDGYSILLKNPWHDRDCFFIQKIVEKTRYRWIVHPDLLIFPNLHFQKIDGGVTAAYLSSWCFPWPRRGKGFKKYITPLFMSRKQFHPVFPRRAPTVGIIPNRLNYFVVPWLRANIINQF